MKKQTPQQKAEQERAEQLRMNCFEKAQQSVGYQCDVDTVITEAKKIVKFIKGK